MSCYDFYKTFKEALFALKENTVTELAECDIDYQTSLKKHADSEDQYLHIKSSLTREQEKTIQDYINYTEENNSDMCDLSYMAGAINMLEFLSTYTPVANKFFK